MSFVYLPERVVDQSPRSGCSDGTPSATSSGTNTASKSCKPESETACLTMPPYGTTLEHSTGDPGADAWILSQRVSRASRSVSPASERARMTNGTCGPIQFESYAKYNRDTHSWRTSQACLFQDTLARFSETWPRAGTILGGAAYRRQRWERRIAEIGCGLWPTPNKTVVLAPPGKDELKHWEKRKRDFRMGLSNFNPGLKLEMAVGGFPNPTWVEWLMGWPLGWTNLKPLAMDRFRKWLRKHGSC